MKVHNCILFSLCSLLILGVISSCTANPAANNIFDDETKISQEGDSYTYVSRLGGVDSDEQLDMSFEGFSGSETIWSFEAAESAEVKLTVDTQIDSGDFKVVLVSPEKEVITIVNGSENSEQTMSLAEGKYLLKLVGRKADGEIKISIKADPKVVITKISDSE